MKRFIPALPLLAASFLPFFAMAETYPVWPAGKIPYPSARPNPGRVLPTTDDDVRYADVDVPTLTYVRTPVADLDKGPVPAVLILPGGGYKALSWTIEGSEIAQWFRRRGFNAYLLKYRVPDKPNAALADAQRAIRIIRANAVRWNVNPKLVGVIGGSAGAHLAARLSTCATNLYAAVDEQDTISSRPDFTVLMYGWRLCRETADGKPLPEPRAEFAADGKTPPAFVVHSQNDPVPMENAFAYALALKRAHVPVELHVFPIGGRGGHGYAFRKYEKPTDAWPDLLELWLDSLLDEDGGEFTKK